MRGETFSDPLAEEQELMDSWRMALVDVIYALSQYLIQNQVPWRPIHKGR